MSPKMKKRKRNLFLSDNFSSKYLASLCFFSSKEHLVQLKRSGKKCGKQYKVI